MAHLQIRLTRRPLRLRHWGLALGLVLPIVACAAGGAGNSQYGTGGDTSSNGGTASGGTTSGGNNGTGGFTGSSGGGGPDAGHGEKCDGNVCTCITIASIGHEGVWGPCSSDSTTAFQQWLNSQSTAVVTSYDQSKPTLTADFLGQYNVIILQWMVSGGMQGNEGSPWAFSQEEVSALETWVKGGGGLIVLSGYNCNLQNCTIQDTVAANNLLSFTDMQLNNDDTLDPTPNGATSTCMPEDCYCWGSALPLGVSTPAIAAPLSTGVTVGRWQGTTIANHVTDLGAFSGRSIAINQANAANVQVDATDGTKVYSAHEPLGKGFVVVYGDEWITYTGEWTGISECQMYPYDSGTCAGKSAAEVFQIPQFWYNAISYASGSVGCFHINNSGIVY